jgi:hypothetical protein
MGTDRPPPPPPGRARRVLDELAAEPPSPGEPPEAARHRSRRTEAGRLLDQAPDGSAVARCHRSGRHRALLALGVGLAAGAATLGVAEESLALAAAGGLAVVMAFGGALARAITDLLVRDHVAAALAAGVGQHEIMQVLEVCCDDPDRACHALHRLTRDGPGTV